MKAAQYKVKDCVLDDEGNIHVLLIDCQSGFFVPVYVSLDQGQLLMMSDEEMPDEIKHLLSFIVDTWTKLGYTIKSIVIDHGGTKGALLPTITFVQNQFDQRYIFLTCFIPVTTAFLLASCFDIPLYLTSATETFVQKISINQMEQYIETVKVKEDTNEERDQE